jgi:hypothetical protein
LCNVAWAAAGSGCCWAIIEDIHDSSAPSIRAWCHISTSRDRRNELLCHTIVGGREQNFRYLAGVSVWLGAPESKSTAQWNYFVLRTLFDESNHRLQIWMGLID